MMHTVLHHSSTFNKKNSYRFSFAVAWPAPVACLFLSRLRLEKITVCRDAYFAPEGYYVAGTSMVGVGVGVGGTTVAPDRDLASWDFVDGGDNWPEAGLVLVLSSASAGARRSAGSRREDIHFRSFAWALAEHTTERRLVLVCLVDDPEATAARVGGAVGAARVDTYEPCFEAVRADVERKTVMIAVNNSAVVSRSLEAAAAVANVAATVFHHLGPIVSRRIAATSMPRRLGPSVSCPSGV